MLQYCQCQMEAVRNKCPVSVILLFVSVPQLKPWGSPSVGWAGTVCSHFPTPVHTILHIHKCSVSFPQLKPWGSPNAGWEGSVCSHFPTPVHTVVRVQVQCCLSLQQQLHSDFGDFNNKVCHGVNVTTAESNPDMNYWHNKHFALALTFWMEITKCQ